MQQVLDYAVTLDIPFVFTSNGDGFICHDRTGMSGEVETTLPLDAFPSPAALWSRYQSWKGLTPEAERIGETKNALIRKAVTEWLACYNQPAWPEAVLILYPG